MAEEVKTIVSGLETSANEFAKGLSQNIASLFEMSTKETAQKNTEQQQKIASLQAEIRSAQRELAANQRDLSQYKDAVLKQIAGLETQIKELKDAKDLCTKQFNEKIFEYETLYSNISKLFEKYIPKK